MDYKIPRHLVSFSFFFDMVYVFEIFCYYCLDLFNLLFCLQDLTLREAETIALSVLKQVMEEKVRPSCKF